MNEKNFRFLGGNRRLVSRNGFLFLIDFKEGVGKEKTWKRENQISRPQEPSRNPLL